MSPLKTIRSRMTPIKIYSRLFIMSEGALRSSMVPIVCDVVVSFVRSSNNAINCWCAFVVVVIRVDSVGYAGRLCFAEGLVGSEK